MECQRLQVSDFSDLKERLAAALAAAKARAAEVEQVQAAARAERQAKITAEREQHAEQKARRYLYPLVMAPSIGRPCRLGSTAVVFTGAGRSFQVTEDHPSQWGHHRLGHEGTPCAYFYYREATEAEAAELAAAEAAALQQPVGSNGTLNCAGSSTRLPSRSTWCMAR